MESWRIVFRKGFLPQFSDAGLDALRQALEEDSKFILQGATTFPPPMACVADFPVEAACPVSYVGWQEGLSTVEEVEVKFAERCYLADVTLGEPAACRHLLQWIDDSPRPLVLAGLLAEVLGEQQRRLLVKEISHGA